MTLNGALGWPTSHPLISLGQCARKVLEPRGAGYRHRGVCELVDKGLLTFLFWQTPRFFDLAKFRKHLLILFINSCSFRQAEKLYGVSMGAVKYEKGIRATGSGFRATDVFIGYIGGIVHDVWNAMGSYAVVLIPIRLTPEKLIKQLLYTRAFR